ncbi:MAG: F0F1 ATP synthase subunit epsilon [Nitrospiria bacterium]
MKTFVLQLESNTRQERFTDTVSFVGEDSSGSFGILSDHTRMMACLKFGLAQFLTSDGVRHYLAIPGALLYFVNNQLHLCARKYLHDIDYNRISLALESQLLAEEENLCDIKESLHRLETEMLKRLWEMQKRSSTG